MRPTHVMVARWVDDPGDLSGPGWAQYPMPLEEFAELFFLAGTFPLELPEPEKQ